MKNQSYYCDEMPEEENKWRKTDGFVKYHLHKIRTAGLFHNFLGPLCNREN
jgi:hypothetical protein